MLWIIQSQRYTFFPKTACFPCVFSSAAATPTYGSTQAGSSQASSSPVGTAGLDPLTLPPSILPQ